MNQPFVDVSHIATSQDILLGILGVVFFIFIIISVILYYHWRTYAERTRMVVIVETVYLSGGALLFTSALGLIGIM